MHKGFILFMKFGTVNAQYCVREEAVYNFKSKRLITK
jgi:hypothetical protein